MFTEDDMTAGPNSGDTDRRGRTSMPAPAVGPSPRATLIISVLSVIAALFGIATAYLGYQTATITKAKDQAQQSAASSSSDITNLQNQVDHLKAENSQLRSELGAPTASPLPSANITVRHSGQLTASSNGPQIDLDSPASDPQWNTGSPEFHVQSGLVYLENGTVLDLGGKKADYDTCHNTTGYTSNHLDTTSLIVGNYLCWKTGDRRYSALRILRLTNESITLDIVTYDPPAAT
jgi:hypothetical protein